MAGGIDWFRWHHGSVNDQKFGLIAKKAGASVAEVIAVWACLLESASASDQRGHASQPDFEAIDFALGIDDGKAECIYTRMIERGLVEQDGRIAAWDRRQPKRERTEDSSTERSRAFRQRQRQETANADGKTPCNATQRQETPRGEESREEDIDSTEQQGCIDADTSPCIAELPLVDGSGYAITEKQIGEWAPAYPGVDVALQVRKAKVWLDSNPRKRKTRRGVARFMTTWLERAQNDGRSYTGPPGAHGKPPDAGVGSYV